MKSPTKPPTDNRSRVFRGGSWNLTSATVVRAAYRSVNSPLVRSHYVGFRTVQSGARQPLKGENPP